MNKTLLMTSLKMKENLSMSLSSAVVDDHWKTIGKVRLLQTDKAILMSADKWLSGNIINATQHLLKSQFPSLSGFQDTMTIKSKRVKPVEGEFIQILHKSESHWVTVSNIATADTEVVSIYDSLNDLHLPEELKHIIAKLLISKKPCIVTRNEDVQLQTDFSSCGLFAIAFATELCFRQDPRKVIFDNTAMRNHLLKCLENETATPFPVKNNRNHIIGRIDSFRIYCSCRLPAQQDDELLSCSLCSNKFHKQCDESSDKHWKTANEAK
eukprot:Seg1446.6 transcript_id=Seg1446.6/GoldUCD/mRNA.D3Y31 product="hypothetical protein" protein_id=Seg1446.6/GoldUCD/D3Y31